MREHAWNSSAVASKSIFWSGCDQGECVSHAVMLLIKAHHEIIASHVWLEIKIVMSMHGLL